MNKQTKEELIENCGKLPIHVRKPNGTFGIVNSGRCGYYHDCATCNGEEAKKRKYQYAMMLRDYFVLYTAVIPKEAASRMSKKLNREKADFISIPYNGQLLYITSSNINYRSFDFSARDAQEVINFISTHDMIFPDGRRSTGGNWNLRKSGETNSEFDYEELVPFFTLTPNANYERLNALKAMAIFWDGGEVTLDNVQHYVDVTVSALVEIAIRNGYKLVPEKCKLIRRSVSADALKKWIVINVNENGITFPNAPLEDVEKEMPDIAQAITGNVGIKNWRLWLLDERKRKLEERKNRKNAKTFSDYGLDVDMVLGVDEAN